MSGPELEFSSPDPSPVRVEATTSNGFFGRHHGGPYEHNLTSRQCVREDSAAGVSNTGIGYAKALSWQGHGGVFACLLPRFIVTALARCAEGGNVVGGWLFPIRSETREDPNAWRLRLNPFK